MARTPTGSIVRMPSRAPPTPTILGGGLAGLTLANALRHVGLDFELYEQAPALTEVGAGIGLAAGTLDVLERLGLAEDVRAAGSTVREVRFLDKRLRVRRSQAMSRPGLCIHRASLVDVLRSGLPEERLHLSRRVTDVRSGPNRAEVAFHDGTRLESACVVAADGIDSVARARLLPGVQQRWIRQTVWRGLTPGPLPEFARDAFVEIWDEGLRFLTAPIRGSDGTEETFWLAVSPAEPGGRDDPETVRDDLDRQFGGFHPVLRALVQESRNVIRTDMGDLGTRRRPWHRGRVVFIGDAIHATTPNLAQGGCQAMEDALCLALALARHGGEVEAAFSVYERLRRRKVAWVVRQSWRWGVAAHSRNPLRHYPFRWTLQYAPAAFLQRWERYLNDLSYLEKAGGAHETAPAAVPPSASI